MEQTRKSIHSIPEQPEQPEQPYLHYGQLKKLLTQAYAVISSRDGS